MTIGELARRGGVGVETVRYYQRRGLLPEPPRRARGFRHYSEENLQALHFIRRAKGLGFTLKEIGNLLPLRAGKKTDHDEVRDVLLGKVVDLERKVADLEVAIRALRRLADEMEVLPPEARWRLLDPDAATPSDA